MFQACRKCLERVGALGGARNARFEISGNMGPNEEHVGFLGPNEEHVKPYAADDVWPRQRTSKRPRATSEEAR